jgi:signal transduction histidine kinase
VTLAKVWGTGTLRLSVIFAAASLVSGVLLFVIIYLKITYYEVRRLDGYVVREAAALSNGSTEEIAWAIRGQFPEKRPDRFSTTIYAALYDPNGRLIAGNVDRMPGDLPADGQPHRISLPSLESHGSRRVLIAVSRRLPDGKLLIFGRGVGVLSALEDIVGQALLLGVIPAIGPALAAGIWLSRRARERLHRVNQSIERIMMGDVHERLPVLGVEDEFDQLADSVNRMLKEIERLLSEVQSVSDNIAHDLRTPLARVRMMLEQSKTKAVSGNEMSALAERAIAGLDQAQSIITALLRIGEIESGQRRSGFGTVDLADIANVVAELYGPIAEEKSIRFVLDTALSRPMYGDRDLMIEVVANLVDNAIKFTRPNGTVRLEVASSENKPVIRVIDNGPGIPEHEWTTVMTRFHRLDKSRTAKGTGLGLSIVQAVVRLHDFTLTIEDARPGCRFEILCWSPEATQPVKRELSDAHRLPPRWASRRGETLSSPRPASAGGL